ERATVDDAGLLQRVDLEVLATARALEVRRETPASLAERGPLPPRHAARSIFAPSARRRVSRSSKPRSICSTLLMTLLPVAHRVAMLVRSVGKPGQTCGFRVGIASPRSGSTT